MRIKRTILLGAVAALLLAALPAGASASVGVAVGLGEQSYSMFEQPNFQALNIKKARYFIKWNAIDDNYQLAQADTYVAQAKAEGVKVFMTPSTDNLALKRAKLPSVAQYKSKVGALVKRYRAQGVTEWGVWNEANHNSQPTYKSPKRAAQFFKTMYSLNRGGTTVALDVLDQTVVAKYIDTFYRSLSRSWRSRAKIVGIHNYSDVNRKHFTGTANIIKAVRRYNSKTKFWLTETGGLVEFGGSFPCNEKRAASAINYMFTIAKKYDRYVDRLYGYSYFGNDCQERFDAGLVNADGSVRPGYTAFKKGIKTYRR
ncbi:MAG: hypothetical protein JWP17_2203 [Solirubrobacterales bacterium]|jgi:hypothetical protein|nr:hypothetical protein [Solirubrobacterales bacterium]